MNRLRARSTLAVLGVLWSTSAMAQSVVGVVGLAEEIAPLERRLENAREVVVRGYVFQAGLLDGRPVVVGRSGAGKVNAAIVATVLIGEFKPSAVLFSGTAGAVDPSLRPGDVVIGDRVAQHDVGLQTTDGIRRRGTRNAVTGALDPLVVPAPATLLAAARQSARDLPWPAMAMPDGDSRRPRVVEGVIVTGDVFLADVSRRAELRTTFGAAAIEMEGAAFVQTCRQFAVPCLVIRSVTDRADGQALTSYERFLAVASENAARLVAAVIARLSEGPP